MQDPILSSYGVVVIDEAHERGIENDVLLGLLKAAQAKRTTLRLVVMSASMDVGSMRAYFNNAPVLRVLGRSYDVEVFYLKRPENGLRRGSCAHSRTYPSSR